MKLKTAFLAGAMALMGLSSASAQTTVINITGATAFRAAMHKSIVAMLGGDPNTGAGVKFAFVGAVGSQFTATDVAIYEGDIGGQPYIIRTRQSGSTQGVKDVVQQNLINTYLDVAATALDRVDGGAPVWATIDAATAAGKTLVGLMQPGVAPQFAFSDVDQALSDTPAGAVDPIAGTVPALTGASVGVVPFVFIANRGSTGITNMTDQLHQANWSTGELPKSMYTGNPLDTTLVFATGRRDGSGTRATILAETRYGARTKVVQWGDFNHTSGSANNNFSGSEGDPASAVLWLDNVESTQTRGGGMVSNSNVRSLLARSSNSVNIIDSDFDGNGGGVVRDGAPQAITIISYLTLSDATKITDLTGQLLPAFSGDGAIDLTYNGMSYTENNVRNGAYSLWGYQQFYIKQNPTAGETTFFNALQAEIAGVLDPLVEGLPETTMNVTRFNGDGGIILPD